MIDTRKLINIDNKMYSEDDLLIRIPDEYKDLVYSVKYKSHAELSRALMFAHCAEEGRYYGNAHQLQTNERELKYCIRKLKEANGAA